MQEKILYDVTACDDTGIRFSVKERLTETDARREVKEILFQFPRKLHNPRIKKKQNMNTKYILAIASLIIIMAIAILKLKAESGKSTKLIDNYRSIKGQLIPKLYAKLYLGKNGPVTNETDKKRLIEKYRRKLINHLRWKGHSRSDLKRIENISRITIEELEFFKAK